MNGNGFEICTHQRFNILELSVMLLMVYCVTYCAKAYACPQSSPTLTEVQHQRQAYTAPLDLGLPTCQEPSGSR